MLNVAPHPLLELRAFTAAWPQPLGQLPSPPWLDALCALDADVPLSPPDDAHKKAVRDMLRVGGFKPAGRSKPCNEYIRAAAAKGAFPRINAPVDLTNAAVLHGALPVSIVDLGRLAEPLSIGIAEKGASYVFNASGQVIDLSGLVCLFDAEGPAANAVKDAQRAKTTEDSQRTLTLIWGTSALEGRADALREWMIEAARRLGADVEPL